MAISSISKVVLVSCLLIGCSSDNTSTEITGITETTGTTVPTFTNQDDHTYYEQVLAPGNECTSDGIFNCTADLYLCSDGSAILQLTDIINEGSFVETEDKIETSGFFGDIPSEINFVKQTDLGLIDDYVGLTWNKEVSEFIASFCDTDL